MTIRVRFPGRCAACGGPIPAGREADWTDRLLRHPVCLPGVAQRLHRSGRSPLPPPRLPKASPWDPDPPRRRR